MRGDVTRLDLSHRWRMTIGCSIGMAIYSIAVVAIYPAFEHSTSLDDFVRSDRAAAALFGLNGPLSTSAGWLNGNIYANFFPLVMLLLTIGYGAAAIAGQDEDGSLALVATLPLSRSAIVVQKVASMVVQAVILAVVVAACVLAGRWFHLSIGLGSVVALSATVLLMGLDFGLVAMAVGAATGRRGMALGVGTAVAGASFLVSSLAPVAGWLHPFRVLSLFYWSVGNDQLTGGVRPLDLVVLIAVGIVAAACAAAAFRRSDLH
jgi:ABC-2 type transport system permease protein